MLCTVLSDLCSAYPKKSSFSHIFGDNIYPSSQANQRRLAPAWLSLIISTGPRGLLRVDLADQPQLTICLREPSQWFLASHSFAVPRLLTGQCIQRRAHNLAGNSWIPVSMYHSFQPRPTPSHVERDQIHP